MIGRTLSHYKVLEEISRGGMGIVYIGYQDVCPGPVRPGSSSSSPLGAGEADSRRVFGA